MGEEASGATVRCAVLDDYQGVALDLADWSILGGEVEVDAFTQHLAGDDDVVAALRGYDIVVAMRERTRFGRAVLERLPELRLLVTTGARNAAIDVDACRELGITVCGTSGSGTATAELTWALILAAARRLPTELQNVRSGGWMSTLGTELRGRTLGVLGLGRLGAAVSTVGLAFGMRVVAWSANLTDDRCAEVGVVRVSREELFATADVLSIHLVLSDRTRHLVGEAELRAMKPTAWLVNTSRGEICDEQALATACAQGWIAGAALDVYSEEPLPADSPWRSLDNAIATPHVGYVTEQTYRQWYAGVVEDIAAYLGGAPIRVLT